MANRFLPVLVVAMITLGCIVGYVGIEEGTFSFPEQRRPFVLEASDIDGTAGGLAKPFMLTKAEADAKCGKRGSKMLHGGAFSKIKTRFICRTADESHP